MIYKLNGQVEDVFTDTIGIVTQGIGYLLHVSHRTLQNIQKGKNISLYIEHLFRQDASQVLVGFYDLSEQESFRLLMTVQGVGMRSALSILSFYNSEQLFSLIVSQDIKSLTRADGIGKKTAERIVLELKNKFKNIPMSPPHSNHKDVFAALEVLGFTRSEILKHIQTASPDLSTEQMIQHILKQVGT